MEQKRALIVSLGGTPEPVVKAIMTHRPEVVCFFASQESIRNVGTVLEGVKGSVEPLRTYTVLADNAEDLVHCYEKALQAAAWIEGQGIPPAAVIVDYTGGTKAMTAALTLATIGKGYRFSYVGGKERNKGGLGTVLTGAEIVRSGIDPWHLFAVEEKRQFALYFNAYQFDAALGVLRRALLRDTLRGGDRKLFEALLEVTEGYLEWDRFNHREAIEKLSKGKRALKAFSEITGDLKVKAFMEAISQNLEFLQTLQKQSKQFNVVCRAMVEDLMANADRRAREGKYDDAVARLYRATEMVAQVRFLKKPLECTTSEVPVERVPKPMREEFRQRYVDPTTGKLKLPLYAAFKLLQVIGSGEGEAFFAREEAFKGLLNARNSSLLAHGGRPVKPETYQRFKALLCEAFGLADLPAFPSLEV